MKEAIRELFGYETEIGANSNTIDLLEEAEKQGLVRRTGAMRMNKEGEGIVNTCLGPMRQLGSLYDEYEITSACKEQEDA